VPTLNIGINTGQPRRVVPTVWDIIGFFNSPESGNPFKNERCQLSIKEKWIPAFAGMTESCFVGIKIFYLHDILVSEGLVGIETTFY